MWSIFAIMLSIPILKERDCDISDLSLEFRGVMLRERENNSEFGVFLVMALWTAVKSSRKTRNSMVLSRKPENQRYRSTIGSAECLVLKDDRGGDRFVHQSWWWKSCEEQTQQAWGKWHKSTQNRHVMINFRSPSMHIIIIYGQKGLLEFLKIHRGLSKNGIPKSC